MNRILAPNRFMWNRARWFRHNRRGQGFINITTTLPGPCTPVTSTPSILQTPVNFAAMGDDPNIDSPIRIVDDIDHAIVSHADTSKIDEAGKFDGTRKPWIVSERDGLFQQARLRGLG